LLSDFLDEKDFRQTLTIANRKHDVVAVQVYDRRVAELPDVGLMQVRDAETGAEMIIDTSSKKLRNQHAAWWRTKQNQLRDTFTRSGVDNVCVRTDQDYVSALMGLFKQRS
jgi:hypothetical protein